MMTKTRIYFIVALIAMAIGGLLGWTRQGQSSSRVAWEYKSVYITHKDVTQAEEILNKAGAEGWEIIFFRGETDAANSDLGRYFLKRPK